MRVWRIRGGPRDALVVDDFWARGFVALSWQEFEGSAEGLDRLDIRTALEPRLGRRTAAIAAGHLVKFAHEVDRGHIVITPTVKTRELLAGRVVGDYRYEPERLSDGNIWAHRRDVEWLHRLSIDALPNDIKKTVDIPPSLQEIYEVDRLLRVLGMTRRAASW